MSRVRQFIVDVLYRIYPIIICNVVLSAVLVSYMFDQFSVKVKFGKVLMYKIL